MYLSVTKKEIETGFKRYCFCEDCGECSFDEWHEGDPIEDCWAWEPKEQCPMKVVTALLCEGHDFIILEGE